MPPDSEPPKKPAPRRPNLPVDFSVATKRHPTAESSSLAELIEISRKAQMPIGHVRDGEDGPELVGVQGKPGTYGTLALDALVPALTDAGNVTRTPFAKLSARHDRLRMSDLIERSSRCVQAGVKLGLLNEPPVLDALGRGPVLKREIDKFRVMHPVPFEIVPDPEATELTPQGLPYDEFQFDREDHLIPVGVSIRVSRANLRDLGADEIAAELMWSIGAGIGQAADRLILEALNPATLQAFSLSAAAARGLFWADLRGIVGAGSSATTENGELRLSGVSSELSQAAAEAGVDIIGAFARAALFMNPALDLFSQREANGGLLVTAWAAAAAAIPTTDDFWRVG